MAAWAPGDTRLGGEGTAISKVLNEAANRPPERFHGEVLVWSVNSKFTRLIISSAKVQIDKRVLIQAALLQMFANTCSKSPSHAWRGFENPVLCKSKWLTCREREREEERGGARERERCGKWKDRVHLLPGEKMGERFTDLWHTHCWSMQREPLCPWKIATWPLFQLCLPLCNCHGCSLNTHAHTCTPGLDLYSKPPRSKGRLTWDKTWEREKKRGGKSRRVHTWSPINQAQHHLCYVFAHVQTFWCVFA